MRLRPVGTHLVVELTVDVLDGLQLEVKVSKGGKADGDLEAPGLGARAQVAAGHHHGLGQVPGQGCRLG